MTFESLDLVISTSAPMPFLQKKKASFGAPSYRNGIQERDVAVVAGTCEPGTGGPWETEFSAINESSDFL